VRIVSFLPAATEMACALGLDDQLVGVSHECDFPSSVRGLPVVVRNAIRLEGLSPREIDDAVRRRLHDGGSLYEVDEVLLADLAPDLILTQDLCQVCAPSGNEVAEALRALASRPDILWFTPRTLADIDANLRSLGVATDRVECAERVIATGHARLRAIEERATSLGRRPRVFVAEWLEPIYASGHWVPEMVACAGGTDSVGRVGAESVRVAFEDVAAWDPDVVVVAPCGYGLDEASRQARALATMPGWRDLAAVRAGRVAAVDANAYVARPGPRIIDGVEQLARIIRAAVTASP